MSDASVCPRCGSTDTNCLGHSMCPGRYDRVYTFKIDEYICNECKLFYKQWREEF